MILKNKKNIISNKNSAKFADYQVFSPYHSNKFAQLPAFKHRFSVSYSTQIQSNITRLSLFDIKILLNRINYLMKLKKDEKQLRISFGDAK